MKLKEEHKKKRTQNWGELMCELDCSTLQKKETKTTENSKKREFDFFFPWVGEVQDAFVFAAVVLV